MAMTRGVMHRCPFSSAPRLARLYTRPAARLLVRASAQTELPTTRRALVTGLLATATIAAASPASAAETFLKSTGVRNVFQEGEEELFRLRQEQEGEARKALMAQIEKLEREAAVTQNGKLCATPFGVDVVGITELIALIGATVAGVAARQRKAEVERLNEQLRKINLSLRQQARAGTVYAPGLTYAPPVISGAPEPSTSFSAPSATAAAATAAPSALPKATPPVIPQPPPGGANGSGGGGGGGIGGAVTGSRLNTTWMSMEEDDMNSDQTACRDALRAGKRLLKEKNGASAMVRFEKALMLSKAMGDKVQERRAMRGLAASARLQGQYKAAIKHLERVLTISAEIHEFTGDADAYGTIADCYTDLGNFEQAAAMYDKYIELMNSDVPARL